MQCKNAGWDGLNEIMLFYDNTTDSIDVFAHEFTHGVTEFFGQFCQLRCPILFLNQMALNESYSDIFAAFIDKQPTVADMLYRLLFI